MLSVDLSSMARRIREAIKTQRIIQIDYAPGRRKVQPHVLGWSSKDNELLRAFQLEGASASGEHANWKLFRVDEIRSMSVLDECFIADRADYNPIDTVMRGGIVASVPKVR